jgi:hypothetical protein
MLLPGAQGDVGAIQDLAASVAAGSCSVRETSMSSRTKATCQSTGHWSGALVASKVRDVTLEHVGSRGTTAREEHRERHRVGLVGDDRPIQPPSLCPITPSRPGATSG